MFLSPAKLPVNPLAPPAKVDPWHWIVIFCDVFTRSTDLLMASKSLLQRCVVNLYKKHGIFDGNSNNYPTLIDLYEYVRSLKFRGNGRQANYQDSVINRLEAFIYLNRESYEFVQGVPYEVMQDMSFVLEMRGLTEEVARFEMNIRNYGLFAHRIATSSRNKGLKTLIIADEASWLAPPFQNPNTNRSPLSMIISKARETGIGMCIADQTNQMDEAVFNNSELIMTARLGNGIDHEKAMKTMRLTEEQTAHIPMLSVGQFIVRVPQQYPFLIQTPKVTIG